MVDQLKIAFFAETGCVAEKRAEFGQTFAPTCGVGFRLISGSGNVYRGGLAAGDDRVETALVFSEYEGCIVTGLLIGRRKFILSAAILGCAPANPVASNSLCRKEIDLQNYAEMVLRPFRNLRPPIMAFVWQRGSIPT